MNEFDFIQRLRAEADSRKHSFRVITGIGDDGCVISQSANRDLIVTTDLLIEGIDFYRHAAPAQMLGHKALAVSLSDIAAMGARPFWSLLSFGMPAETWQEQFKDGFYEGYFQLADQFGVTLAGGDVSESSTGVVIDSIVLGETANGAAVTRSGAQPGDQIYVTGTLGGAAAGLKLIQMGARMDETGLVSLPRPGQRNSSSTADERGSSALDGRGSSPTVREGVPAIDNTELKAITSLLLRQHRPSPRVGWGIILGEEQLATAMIDISDGLSSDIAHLCEASGVGALMDASTLPIEPDVSTLCGRRALDPLMLALHGGEDFELLFTVRPDEVARLPKRVDGVAITRIGEVTDQSGKVQLAEKGRVSDLRPGGFEHFKGT
ncbi:MAG: thiamine-monophosphate kinase [Blastocatellia bacterium]|jgi:thiamine-monophosphate kinase|nr:thiamine-monophosphate kinase [Blastocatellia bacterium]